MAATAHQHRQRTRTDAELVGLLVAIVRFAECAADELTLNGRRGQAVDLGGIAS